MAQNTPAANLAHAEAPPVSGVEVWLETNFKKVLIAALLLVLAILAYGLIHFRTQAVENEAAEAFTAAETVDELDSVINKHGGTAAAANALLAKADLLWSDNKKDQSVAALREFVANESDHPLLVPTLLSLGSKLESMDENKDANEIYQQVVNEYTESPMAPLAEIRQADLLWKEGKVDEAKAIYEGLPSKYPSTNQPFFDESQNRLVWLGANLPTTEVDGPPIPEPADPTSTSTVPGIQIPMAPPNAGGAPQIQLGGANQSVTITPDGGAVTAPITIPPSGGMPKTAPAPEVTPTPKPETPAAPKADAPPAPKAKAPAAKTEPKAEPKAKPADKPAPAAQPEAPAPAPTPEPKTETPAEPKAE